MSREDQSLSRQIPKICSSAFAIGILVSELVSADLQKTRLPLRNRARASARISDRHCHRAFVRMAAGPACRSQSATTRVRDSRLECTGNSAAEDCRDEIICRRSWHEKSTHRSRCNLQQRRARASPRPPAEVDDARSPDERGPQSRCAAEHGAVVAMLAARRRPGPSAH